MERKAVIAEAMTWRGTPFRDCARLKGQRGGVDCAQFLCAVYEASGVSGHVETERYNLQALLNVAEEDYVAELLKHCHEVQGAETLPADIVVFRWGKSYSHGAILVDSWQGRIIHALNGFGVIVTDAARDGRILATIRKHQGHPPRFFRPAGW